MNEVKQWNIIPNMEQYKEHSGLDYHDVVALLRSPDHYVNGVHPERSVIKQDIIDAICNPPYWFNQRAWIEGDLRLKANKEQKKKYESEGLIVVKKEHYFMVDDIVCSTIKHKFLSEKFHDCKDGDSLFYYSDDNEGVTFKAEIHKIFSEGAIILKPISDARKFQERATEYRWDIQSRIAEMVLKDNIGRKIPVYFAAIETEKPHGIMIYRMTTQAHTDGDIGIAKCVYQDRIIPNDIRSYPEVITQLIL